MKYIFLSALIILALMTLVAESIKPKPVQDGKTVLTWTEDDNPTRRDQVALFNELHDQYVLSLDTGNHDLSKVIVQSIGGVGPDLISCHSGFALSAFVKSDIAWDITDKVSNWGVDLENDLWNGANPCLIYDGRVYGLPNNVAVDALWFHPEMFDKAGIPHPEAPWTWEEFIPMAEKLMLYDEKGRVTRYGFLFEWWRWPMFMRQWGGRVYSEDGTRCEIDCPETVAAIQFMQDLIYKHGISPSPIQESAMTSEGGWGTGTLNWYGAKRGATALGGRWWLMQLKQYDDISMKVVESPHGPKRAYHSYGRATIINRSSPRREEALDFLRYLLSKDYNMQVNHQGDAMGPVKKFSMTDEFLHDPGTPGADWNTVWREVTKYGVPEQTSIYVNGGVVDLIINHQLDLVKNNMKSAKDAMKDAAEEINAEIQANIEREPTLRERYDKAVRTREKGESVVSD